MPTKLSFLLVALLACFTSSSGLAESLVSQHTELVLHAEVPNYPALAITAHISGGVRLHVTVDGGVVVEAKSDAPASLLMLVNAATASVKTWRFVPVAHGFFDVTFTFEISEHEAALPSNPHIEMQLPDWVKITATPVRPSCSDCSPDAEAAPEAQPETNPKPPERVLFEGAELAVKQNRFEVAHISLQTLINTYPDSEYASKARELLKDPRIAPCGAEWSVGSASDECDGRPATKGSEK